MTTNFSDELSYQELDFSNYSQCLPAAEFNRAVDELTQLLASGKPFTCSLRLDSGDDLTVLMEPRKGTTDFTPGKLVHTLSGKFSVTVQTVRS